MILKKNDSHVIYNILLPAERVIILLIYAANELRRDQKQIHYLGIVLVLVITISGAAYYGSVVELHNISNVLSGLVLAALSYLQLRSIAQSTAGQSRVLFYFGLANLVYCTLMVSAMSAFPLAMQIDPNFASNIISINLLAYTLWSIILIIGILWKKKQKI